MSNYVPKMNIPTMESVQETTPLIITSTLFGNVENEERTFNNCSFGDVTDSVASRVPCDNISQHLLPTLAPFTSATTTEVDYDDDFQVNDWSLDQVMNIVQEIVKDFSREMDTFAIMLIIASIMIVIIGILAIVCQCRWWKKSQKIRNMDTSSWLEYKLDRTKFSKNDDDDEGCSVTSINSISSFSNNNAHHHQKNGRGKARLTLNEKNKRLILQLWNKSLGNDVQQQPSAKTRNNLAVGENCFEYLEYSKNNLSANHNHNQNIKKFKSKCKLDLNSNPKTNLPILLDQYSLGLVEKLQNVSNRKQIQQQQQQQQQQWSTSRRKLMKKNKNGNRITITTAAAKNCCNDHQQTKKKKRFLFGTKSFDPVVENNRKKLNNHVSDLQPFISLASESLSSSSHRSNYDVVDHQYHPHLKDHTILKVGGGGGGGNHRDYETQTVEINLAGSDSDSVHEEEPKIETCCGPDSKSSSKAVTSSSTLVDGQNGLLQRPRQRQIKQNGSENRFQKKQQYRNSIGCLIDQSCTTTLSKNPLYMEYLDNDNCSAYNNNHHAKEQRNNSQPLRSHSYHHLPLASTMNHRNFGLTTTTFRKSNSQSHHYTSLVDQSKSIQDCCSTFKRPTNHEHQNHFGNIAFHI